MSGTSQGRRKRRKISKNKESRPSWNEKAAQLSQQCGLDVMNPQAAERKGEKIKSHSWFSIVKNRQAPIINGSSNLPPRVNGEKEPTRARHVRLYPTAKQHETLRK